MSLLSLARFKCCTKCECTKPATLDFFHLAKKGLYGLYATCKVCRATAASTRYQNDVEPSTKCCCTCKVVKSSDEFDYDKRAPGGRARRCKDCCFECRQGNRDTKAAYFKQYVIENPEIIKARDKRYRERHKARLYAEKKEYRKRNAQKIAQIKRRYYQANREKCKAWFHLRRSKQREEAFDADDLWQMYDDQMGLCSYCEIPLFGSFHIEHMIPISRDGAGGLSNIALSCASCNLRKHDKTAEEFMEWLKQLSGRMMH